MRLMAAAAACAFLAGCAGSDNPWDTEEDRELFEEKKAEILELELEAIRTERERPTESDEDLAGLDFTAWKAATVEIASRGTLERMRTASEARIEMLAARVAAAKAAPDRLMEQQGREAARELAFEKKKLAHIRSHRGR